MVARQVLVNRQMRRLVYFMVLVHASFGFEITSFSKVIPLSQSVASSTKMTAVKAQDVIKCAKQCAQSQTCGSFVVSSGNHSCQTFNSVVRFSDGSARLFGINGYLKHNWCPTGYSYVEKTDGCLKVVQNQVTFSQAETACSNDGALLLNLQATEKYSVVRSFLEEKGPVNFTYWLGGSDKKEEGVWRWSDGSLVKHMNVKWCTGEPNNDTGENFMEMKKPFKCANDAEKYHDNYYICELSTVRVP